MHVTKNLFLQALFVGLLCNLCRSYKILIVFPMIGKSHNTLARSCAQLLLEAGHQVTLLKWGLDTKAHQNLTIIDIRVPISLETRYSLKQVLSGKVNLNNMREFTLIMSDLQRKILQHHEVQKLIHDPNEHFDVAILEWIYGEYIVGYIQSMEEKAYQSQIAPLILKRRGVVPSYNELRYNASLVLGNSHVSVGRSIPLPAAYKTVGGYHVEKSTELLPKDIELLMNKSTNGVIYFSLGSGFKSTDLPADTIDKLLKIFSGLKQTVLWKYEEDLPNRPSNVHIVSWAPQRKILAHLNCILFISHGGQLSVLEAVHYGVPVIGVPIFVDQHTNVKTLAAKGMAKVVDVYNLAIELEEAIKEMLGKSRYSQAAKQQSLIYHHRPISPGAEMVYWVEYVIQTNGATHLRSISLMVPWYQKCYLDFVVLMISVIVLLVLAVKRLLLLTLNRGQVKVKKMQ